jgi:Fic family protein
MLDIVEKTANHTNTLIDNILDQMEASLEYGKSSLSWYNKEVNELLFTQPYSKREHLAKLLSRTSRTTIKKYMDQLVDAKIVRPIKNWRETYFVNDELISILES